MGGGDLVKPCNRTDCTDDTLREVELEEIMASVDLSESGKNLEGGAESQGRRKEA